MVNNRFRSKYEVKKIGEDLGVVITGINAELSVLAVSCLRSGSIPLYVTRFAACYLDRNLRARSRQMAKFSVKFVNAVRSLFSGQEFKGQILPDGKI